MNRTRTIRTLLLAGSALLLAVGVVGPAAAGPASHQTSDTLMFDSGAATGDANLVRTDRGITLNWHSEAAPASYTIWWVIFNDPGACAATPCGPGDLATPEVEASVQHATGHVVGDDRANFGASLAEGSQDGIVFGPGLLDARAGEIHVVLRGHGPLDPDRMPEQIHEIEFGCGTCADVQFAIFLP